MRVYLDNCCYNRPYDNQLQLRIFLETQAKLHIQDMIRHKKLELVASYILTYENSRNPHSIRKQAIETFLEMNTTVYIGAEKGNEVQSLAEEIMATGIKTADAYHVSCAILGKSDFFLSTDNRLLKLQTNKITLLDPVEFIRRTEDIE